LPPWLTSETEIQTLAARVNLWLRKASQELDRGRNDLARHALEQALQLAAPENLRRPIVEAPPRLRRFLRHEQELVKRHLWLGSAIAGTPTIQPASAPATLIEPLTDREHEVLCNMAALLSNDEIAQKMFVSVNTVKTHIRGILRKLSANRRNEAIRRACELGLLRVRGNGTFAGSSKVIGV
jgi:LuxR family maltose regulon positive regulatory protein